jgi:hypothetical protein
MIGAGMRPAISAFKDSYSLVMQFPLLSGAARPRFPTYLYDIVRDFAATATAAPRRGRARLNLQTGGGLTVKEAAKLMNVSERSVYLAAKVIRLRPDLAERIERGEMKINQAIRIIDGKTARPPNREERHQKMAAEATPRRLDRLAAGRPQRMNDDTLPVSVVLRRRRDHAQRRARRAVTGEAGCTGA